MRANRYPLWSVLLVLLLVLLYACGGGGGASPTGSAEDSSPLPGSAGTGGDTSQPQSGTTNLNAYGPLADSISLVDQGPFGVPLPAFPSDDLDRQISELVQVAEVGGLDYLLRSENTREVDQGLEFFITDQLPAAWALYRFTAVDPETPDSPLTITSEMFLSPDQFSQEDQGYWIGVSNYTTGEWEWHGPFQLPEQPVELDPAQRHTSLSGNLYFILLLNLHPQALHQSSTLWRDQAPPPEPELGILFGRVWEAGSHGEKGIAGASIRLFALAPDGSEELVQQTTSGENGEYAMDGIEPGEYLLSTTAEGYQPLAEQIAVHAGENPHDIELTPSQPQTEPHPAALVGRVFDETNPDHGIVGAVLQLFRLGENGSEEFVEQTESGENGHYAFDGLEPGLYLLFTEHPDYMSKLEELELAAGINEHPVPLTPVAQQNGYLFGQVFEAGSGGEVPIPGALVQLLRPLPDGSEELVDQAETDQQGHYIMDGIAPGPYLVRVSHPDYETSLDDLFIHPGENQYDVDLVPRGGGGVGGAYLFGQVFVAGHPDQPVVGALLKLYRLGEDGSEDFVEQTESGPEGHYAFDDLEPGHYLLITTHPDYLPRGDQLLLEEGENEHPVPLQPRGQEEGASLSGIVFDADTFQPLAETWLTLWRMVEGEWVQVAETQSGEGGFYQFDPVDPGPYLLRAELEGYQPYEDDILLEAGENWREVPLHEQPPQ